MKRIINIPIFVSHQGCPNDCIFCNQKSITGVREEESSVEIKDKVERFLETCKGVDAVREIAFFGGSFTGIEEERQIEYLSIASDYYGNGVIDGIRISTRPDYINPKICQRLKQYHVTTVELGVQSMDDEVLWKNRRGLTSKDTVAAVTQLRGYPFSVGLQMMTGMYGSDREKDLDTARQIISLKPDFVRIYPTIVLKQTVLYHLYSQGSYQPMELEESVALSAELLDLFDRASIPVIRLGLMAGEEVNEKEVIGPFHSSYRELVESYRILREIERQLEGKTTEGKTLRIVCPKRMLSKVIGNRKKNRKLLEEKYGLSVVITPSDTFSSGLSVTLI